MTDTGDMAREINGLLADTTMGDPFPPCRVRGRVVVHPRWPDGPFLWPAIFAVREEHHWRMVRHGKEERRFPLSEVREAAEWVLAC